MGYTTYFQGSVKIEPPLNEHEVAYLKDFAGSRRMKRTAGPYFADPGGDFGQGSREDEVLEYNQPDDEQPGLWCQWIPSDDGTELMWDRAEKFYNSAEWMTYLIQHFLKPDARAKTEHQPLFKSEAGRFKYFTFDHVCNGTIYAQGEQSDDLWKIVVTDNEVKVYDGYVIYEDEIAAQKAKERA